eukprot:TRINITY_DN15829_c0_g1_i1.p1 TRINITY_DN15829_c0_g1~~TRINITY_DN15829_c0_g1_i1.p1  ORF type:complete len:353 (+),score=78.10 TRINITY_DN15829_c0_g1_i1:95-1153(+)
MKWFVFSCIALLGATVVCEEDDFLHELLLDANVHTQYSSLAQIMNGLAGKPSYDCDAYCNGKKVTDLETPSCKGAFYMLCEFKYDGVEGKSSYSCVGEFKRTKTSEAADVSCEGMWHSHSADSIHHHGHDACEVSGMGCGGSLHVKYNLPKYTGSYSAGEEQQVNYTCKGTESIMHAMSKDKADSVQVENVEDLDDAVNDYFLNEYGVQLFMDDEEFDSLQAKHHHFDLNCTATCGKKSVDPLQPVVCSTHFDESCSGQWEEQPVKFTQDCSGIYTGAPKCAEACLGKYSWDWSSDKVGCAGYCTKAFGHKIMEGHKGVASVAGCVGESFAAVKHPADSPTQQVQDQFILVA